MLRRHARPADIEDETIDDHTNVIILHDPSSDRALLPTFTEADFASRFILTMRGMPPTAHVVRVESPADLTVLLQALAYRMGLKVDLLVDASDTFQGWQIAHSVATEVMANVH